LLLPPFYRVRFIKRRDTDQFFPFRITHPICPPA
jgi:hypothetical protein